MSKCLENLEPVPTTKLFVHRYKKVDDLLILYDKIEEMILMELPSMPLNIVRKINYCPYCGKSKEEFKNE